ncbi:hypothetical protein [Streptomyces sp. NPDC003832]
MAMFSGPCPVWNLGGVLAEGGVSHEVEPVFDDPLRTNDLREPLRGGFPAGQIGDHVNGLPAAPAGLQAGAMAYDPGDLCGVREVKVIDG